VTREPSTQAPPSKGSYSALGSCKWEKTGYMQKNLIKFITIMVYVDHVFSKFLTNWRCIVSNQANLLVYSSFAVGLLTYSIHFKL
jgi:hypothetical protein